VGTTFESLERHVTGLDAATRDWVASTPGARALLRKIAELAPDPGTLLPVLEEVVKSKVGKVLRTAKATKATKANKTKPTRPTRPTKATGVSNRTKSKGTRTGAKAAPKTRRSR
jgi:hypothetical protein